MHRREWIIIGRHSSLTVIIDLEHNKMCIGAPKYYSPNTKPAVYFHLFLNDLYCDGNRSFWGH